MKTILKSGLALLLVLMMLIPVLASCNGSKDSGITPTGTGKSGETEAPTTNRNGEEEEVEVLPEVNYDNRVIKILMRDYDYYVHDMEIEDDMINQGKANKVDEQVYYRNRAVEKRLGVLLKVDRQSGNGNLLDAAGVRNLLNDGTYDLIADHGRGLFTYAVEGRFKNWYDLKYVDLTKSWWSQGMVSDFTILDTVWCMTGDLSYQGIGATVVMAMNKKVLRDLVLDDPYEAVLNGTWTFDMFYEMVAQAKSNDGSGTELNPENGDLTGYMTTQWRGPMTALYSAGLRAIKVGEDGNLQMTVNSQKTILLFDDFFRLLNQDNVKIYYGNMPSSYYKTFATGNVLFMDTRLYDISKVIENDFLDYGILPWPKYDTEVDEYYAWVDAVANVFGVPLGKSEEDYECISAVLEALAAEGHRRVIPAFYEDTIQKKYAQDSNSFRALELIRAGRVYDLASYMAKDLGTLSSVGYTIAGMKTQSYSEWWSTNGSGLQGKIDQLNTELKKLIATKY